MSQKTPNELYASIAQELAVKLYTNYSGDKTAVGASNRERIKTDQGWITLEVECFWEKSCHYSYRVEDEKDVLVFTSDPAIPFRTY